MGKNNQCLSYTVDQIPVEAVTTIKDLGVYIDSNLTFKPHLDYIINRAVQRSAIIYRSFKNNDTDFRLKLYTIFILPIITSCSTAFHMRHQGYRDKLEKIQRNYTSYNFKYHEFGALSYEERCKALSIPTLIVRLKARDLQILSKVVQGKIYLSENFIEYNRSNRGHDHKLFKPRHNKASPREFYFYNRTLDNYNKLPENLNRCLNIHTLTTFIQSLS